MNFYLVKIVAKPFIYNCILQATNEIFASVVAQDGFKMEWQYHFKSEKISEITYIEVIEIKSDLVVGILSRVNSDETIGTNV